MSGRPVGTGRSGGPQDRVRERVGAAVVVDDVVGERTHIGDALLGGAGVGDGKLFRVAAADDGPPSPFVVRAAQVDVDKRWAVRLPHEGVVLWEPEAVDDGERRVANERYDLLAEPALPVRADP
jgi:hypothetical protein